MTNHPVTILVVDHYDFADPIAEVLKKGGYATLKAYDGLEAKRVYEKHNEAIDAVITELRIPHLNGFELIEGLCKKNPALPILLTSGYISPFSKFSDFAYLQSPLVVSLDKPFLSDSLLKSLELLLKRKKVVRVLNFERTKRNKEITST